MPGYLPYCIELSLFLHVCWYGEIFVSSLYF